MGTGNRAAGGGGGGTGLADEAGPDVAGLHYPLGSTTPSELSMCGRFVLKAPPAKLADYFNLDAWEEVVPRYNIPPGTAIAVIRQ